MYNTLVKRVLQLADEQPNQLAVAFKKEKLNYQQLKERMQVVAEGLLKLNIKPGDRILFTALSKPEMVAVYLGIQYIGAIAVFIDKNSTIENAVSIYEESGAVLFLTDRMTVDLVNRCRIFSLKELYHRKEEGILQAYVMPDDSAVAELLFTSGTTGKPKGVILTYWAVYHILWNTIDGIGIREDERILLPLPLNHSFALRVLRAALYRGAAVILQNGFAFAKEIEDNLNTYGCTALAAVPASMEILYDQMQEKFAKIMGRFRYIEVSAGSLTIAQRKRFVAQLPETVIYNTWGSSETGGALFINVSEVANDPVLVGAVGKPLPCVAVKILDELGNEIAGNREHPGRMALKGDMQMSGYWNQKELTEETLQEGWLLTGDLVYKDQDGYIYMLGRADDIINVGGEKVSPVEVENVAGQYEHIRECACIGVDDSDGILGQVPALFVVAKDSRYSETELKTFLAEHLERYKVPVFYIPIQEIPRNRMQKTDRKILKRLWEDHGTSSLMNPIMQAILCRRSIRKFNGKPIPRDILDMIVRAGYFAPSGHNMQTWRFTILTDGVQIKRLKEVTEKTAKVNKVYCYGFENPTCIILISNDKRNRYGCQDASCAAENIFLAAYSYGIGSVWLNPLMTLRDKEPVKEVLDEIGIPENHIIWCMAALGYPAEDGKLLAKKEDVVYYYAGKQ